MNAQQHIVFGPFRLDLRNEQLWCGAQAMALKPKALAVLRYLAARPGQLVTKEDLLDAVWAEVHVGDAVLKVCMREIRRALGDDAKTPHFIQTVHRRGYRFIASVSAQPLEAPAQTAPETVPRKEIKRKLAAILSADVQGYSRLMGEDEAATIRTLTTYREVMASLIQQHHGRVVDAPGDNLLAEFASAVDAVAGAVAIQQELQTRNAELPATRKMAYRIGINVGDVVIEGERIYGEGVNIAARLESLAEGGGLCVSGTVYDQVKTKVALAYASLGERQVKNIAEPVRVYRVEWEPEALSAHPPPTPAARGLRPSPPPDRPRGAKRSQPLVPVVGRAAELVQLHEALETARSGERRIIFVTGEAGIGKTTLVEAFLDQIASREEAWIGRGQCIEQYGAGEAYLPVLEAVGRLCREPGGERFVELLHQYAPTWLVQMPALLDATALETLQRKVMGATRERMLREMAEAIEALTQEHPLVLRIEDLHWSDLSTLDLLAYLARRPGPARLLVVGTYRPVDVIVGEHPLRTVKQELQLHGQCEELRLEFLNEAAVREYLTRRFGVGARQAASTERVARVLHQRTEGNPLFMVNVVEALVRQGVITQRDGNWEVGDEIGAITIPSGLQQFIEQQIERMSPEEQRMLAAACVAGMDFSVATVAAALQEELEGVEQWCEALARRGQFVQGRGPAEWPDGTVAGRYSFLHGLFQETLYERVPAGQRLGLHRRIGERLEAAYGSRATEIAAELAVHFERGRDPQRAVPYLRQAGENAVRRSAHQEAITLLTKGLDLLKTLPDTLERAQQELRLQIALGTPLSAIKGLAAPEVEHAYMRARELCQQIGESPLLFAVLGGLCSFYRNRAELPTALELAEQLLRLAQSVQDPRLLVWAHHALGFTLHELGELTSARAHLEEGISLYDPKQGSYGGMVDPGVGCLSKVADVLRLLGYPAQALERSQEALALARELAHPFGLVAALGMAGWIHWWCGEQQATWELAEEGAALAREQGFGHWLGVYSFHQGVKLTEQGELAEGIVQMRQCLATLRAMGRELGRPLYLSMLVEAYGRAGQVEEGLSALEEALATVHKTGERRFEAELYRLKGELTLQSGVQSPESRVQKEAEAEEYFQQAIDIARRQSAKSWELRAVMSLSRLWQKQDKKAEAARRLAEIYNWFTEGFDTADLKEAQALLSTLS